MANDYLEKIVTYFEKDESIVAIGSKILLHYEDDIPRWENKYLNSLLGWFDEGDEEHLFSKKSYPRGSNMSFRMSVFDQIGTFNTDLGRKGNNLAGSEEKDIFNRIYDQINLNVLYVPDAIVYHCVPLERTTKNFIKMQALGTGEGERIRVKNGRTSERFKRYFMEFVKWVGSIALFFIFLFKGEPNKGTMIVKFRWWVSLALFGLKKKL